MKNNAIHFFIIVCIVFFSLTSCNPEPIVPEESKSRVEIVYYEDGVTIKNQTEYDNAGNILKSTNYKSDGNLSYWYENVYDSNGYRTRTTYYKSDGNISYWYEYEYGDLIYWLEYEYSNGNTSRIIRHNADGTIIYYLT